MSDEVKIRLEGLSVGMYVSRLDRSWMEVPTAIEGILIQSGEDIDFIRKYCNHVYVDTSKGVYPSPVYWVQEDRKSGSSQLNAYFDESASKFTLVKKEEYEITTSLQDEFITASKIHADITNKITQAYNNIKNYKKFNLTALTENTARLVESILHNPTAFQFLVQIKKIDDYSYSHAIATSAWCAQMGRSMGLDIESINHLSLGGLLLDIGKTKLPPILLSKQGRLSKNEIQMLRSHVDHGVKRLIEHHDIPHDVIRMVATHHERANGTGYPLGINGDEIPVFGHIAGLIDSFDAMVSARPFKPKQLSSHQAVGELYKQKGQAFQTELIELFIKTIGLYPCGTVVELNSGEVGVVIKSNPLQRLQPTVAVLTNTEKKAVPEFYSIDLSKQLDYQIKQDLPVGSYGVYPDAIFL